MTVPRDPGGPYDRDPYEQDPHGRGRPDEPEGTAAWGRPPAGGWGAPQQPGAGYDQPGGYDRPGYGRGAPGGYGSEPQYGWQQPGPATGTGTGSYPVGPPYEPSWGQGYPAAPPRRAARRRGRLRLAVAGLVALVVVAVLVLGFVAPGWFVTRVFDTEAVQSGVAQILTDDYGADGVADVRCPAAVEVVPEVTFSCDATIDGDPVTVPVRVTDDDGGYEVGRPG